MSTMLHLPMINTAPFMLKDKLGDPFAPAFTAVNGRPSVSSPQTSTGLRGVTAWDPVPRESSSRPRSNSISPTMTNGDRSPESKRKRSRSPEDQQPRGSSSSSSPTAPYPEQRPNLEPHQRTLPPIDQLQSERRWTADTSEYQDHRHHESRPSEPTHPMPSSHISDSHEYEESTSDQNRIDQHNDQRKVGRKRQFANRTKTGCGTCRRRKKKCDEAKPKCNNCTRGNFECAGYANKIPWSKEGASKAPPALQAKERVSSAEIPFHFQRLHVPHCESTHKYTDSNGSDSARGRPVSVDEQERKPS